MTLQTTIQRVIGYKAAGIHAGLKADNALDMALIASDRNCVTAGVFTRNNVKAAPVLLNMERLQTNPAQIRAVVINTKSANACTGEMGMTNARRMAELAANRLDCTPEQVLVMSTGVIGNQLPMEKIEQGIGRAHQQLGQHWQDAATAIMTTDTQPKLASITVRNTNGEYTIGGITKGSGMIAPNMATMLGVLVTDAKVSAAQLQTCLSAVNEKSFNRIVVDGDTSTNDMVVLLANGASGVEIHSETDVREFTEALSQVATYLAKAVVRDGEGVSKFITLDVRGAQSDEDAAQIAHTIAASPLVKTAFYGNDANWGRILAAAGRSGIAFDPDKTQLWMGSGEYPPTDNGLLLYSNGTRADYEETHATATISKNSVYVILDVGTGTGQALIWTCDLSHEYVSINADYRT